MNVSGSFIRRPIGTSLLAIGLFVGGMICYFLLGVSALPNMQFPAIFVQASQAGADASTMASTVAAPLERHLGQVPGIETMRSSSSEGRTFVFMMFRNGTDLDSAARDVQAAINSAAPDLPSGLNGAPSYQKANPNDDPVIAFALTSDTQAAGDLYNVADTLLAQRLRQLPGVSSVEIAGASTPAIRVDVNLRALNAMGLSPDQLRNALRAANVTSPEGFLSDGKTRMAVAATTSLHSAADFAKLVVASHDGTPVRLADVANVYAGTEDAYQAAWFGGQPAVLMYVYKKADANVISTVDLVKAQLPALRTFLQPGTRLTPFFDGTPTIRASLHEVQATLLISLAMVVLTMALFLRRLAPTLIAAVAVPLSLAGAFVAMYILDYTLNNLTLLALVIAIGFVVDDAIVVIENIIRHIDEGMDRKQATLAGAREIGFTIVSITASLVAVFIPLLFAGGITGMFMHEFAVTLVAAIVVSAAVSLTLTPALCGRFLGGHRAREASAGAARSHVLDRFHAAMLAAYRRALDFSLRHVLAFSLTPLVLIVATFYLFTVVKTGLFPQQDTGLIWGRATSSATVSFDESRQRLERLTAMLLADPDVATVGTRLGSSRQGASGSFNIDLKTRSEGRTDDTFTVLARLSAKAAKYP
ncbi:MAG TPA: efflux RND transporter permease subunit, partial [Rhodanobacter sp.]|nr:efflux RND transporter permease subunit [Rhodanobacter sp.]